MKQPRLKQALSSLIISILMTGQLHAEERKEEKPDPQGFVGGGLVVFFGYEIADVCVDFLCLFGCGCFACADRPNWLVCEYYFVEVFLAKVEYSLL